MNRVHLDHNATTPMRPEVREALLEALDAGLGNASSVHGSGRRARAAIDDARERISAALGVDEDEIVFTSGGTESNNLAIFGTAEAGPADMPVVTSSIEHAAVLQPVGMLEQRGHTVTRVPCGPDGRVDPGAIQAATQGHRGSPALVSVMAANNELGSTIDLPLLSELLGRTRGAPGTKANTTVLHTDAVQLLGKRPAHGLLEWVDLATLSAHKVGGPVGVGLLLKRIGTPLAAQLHGGAQEAEIRPGTENVASICAAARAIELAVQETEEYATRSRALVEDLWKELSSSVPNVHLNGPPLSDPSRLPNTLNVSMPDAGDARMLVTRLDLAGLEVSAGSACASGSLEPSHVLTALGHDLQRARSAVRMSVGRTTSKDEISTAVDRLRITLGKAS